MSHGSEIGSEFHWMTWPESGSMTWPEPKALYSLGRDAVHGAWEILRASRDIQRLFVPDYFCHEVSRAWTARGIPVQSYFDNPSLSQPRWDDLGDAGPEDLVLAVNYFGVRSQEPWIDWRATHPEPLLLEDHSHDPGSCWALGSQADFAFASVRKVLPLPEGAVLWSPRGHELPTPTEMQLHAGSALKLAAMMLKGSYLDGSPDPAETKERFRGLQAEGERQLTSQRLARPAPWTRDLLARGYPSQWRRQRELNVRRLLELVDDQTPAEALFRTWPDGHCPLAAVFLFPSLEMRQLARNRLIESDVFPTVLWTMDQPVQPESDALADRLLCLPADQRYGPSEMERIRDVVTSISWDTPAVKGSSR
jgi:hypothetical protein